MDDIFGSGKNSGGYGWDKISSTNTELQKKVLELTLGKLRDRCKTESVDEYVEVLEKEIGVLSIENVILRAKLETLGKEIQKLKKKKTKGSKKRKSKKPKERNPFENFDFGSSGIVESEEDTREAPTRSGDNQRNRTTENSSSGDLKKSDDTLGTLASIDDVEAFGDRYHSGIGNGEISDYLNSWVMSGELDGIEMYISMKTDTTLKKHLKEIDPDKEKFLDRVNDLLSQELERLGD